jgi:hypothetical protein
MAERAEQAHKKTEESGEALKAELDALQKALREYTHALERSLANPRMFDIESSFHQLLQEQLEQLKQLEQELDEHAPRSGIARAAEILKALTTQEQEQIAETVRQMKAVAALLAHADTFVAISAKQEETVRFARRFAEQQELSRINRMEMAEIGSGEQRVHDELREFLDTLPALIQALPVDETYKPLRDSAMNFLYTAEGIDILSDLEQAVSGFTELDGPQAYPAALAALEKMQQLIAQHDAREWMEDGEQCLRFQPSIGRSLGGTLQQILDAMNGGGAEGPSRGYSMLAEQIAVYGPDAVLPRLPETGGQDISSGSPAVERTNVMDDSAAEPELERPDAENRVKAIEQMTFPARYRRLIGDYFRKISEEGTSE